MAKKGRKLKYKIPLEREVKAFHRELRRRLVDFITGAFAFVAALLWRDAINKFLDTYVRTLRNAFLVSNPWIADLVVAIAVSVIAVAAIVVITRLLKPEQG